MKEITSEFATSLEERLASDEVREIMEETKNAADTGSFKVIITTENLDRYDEVISLDGWELDHYRRNPVVLWGHDHNRIIGVCTDVRRTEQGLVAEGKFAPTEEGQEKRKLYDEGFLKATSVGFISKEREGNLITKAELIEFSFVSVPANPYALALALEKERSVDELITKGILEIDTKMSFKAAEVEDETDEDEDAPADADEEDTSGEKDAEADTENEDTDTEEDTPEEVELTEEEKRLAGFIVKEVVVAIKDGALDEETQERTDDEGDEDTDPEVKEFELKKQVQALDTFLGEFLAEKRLQK